MVFFRRLRDPAAGVSSAPSDLPPPYQSGKSTSTSEATSDSRWYEQTMIIVGPEETQYVASRRLLCDRSGYIRLTCLNFRGATIDNMIPIWLPTTETTVFGAYLLHISGQDLPSQTQLGLAKLYSFGCEMGDLKFANYISDALLKQLKALRQPGGLASEMLQFAYAAENGGEVLQRLCLDWYVHNMSPSTAEWLRWGGEGIPRKFILDMLCEVTGIWAKYAQSHYAPKDLCNAKRCTYHKHNAEVPPCKR